MKWFIFFITTFLILSGCSTQLENNENIDSNKTNEVISHSSSTGSSNTEQINTIENEQATDFPTFKAKVVSVIDGDTIKVSINDQNNKTEKIRLLLVDTPETVSPKVGVQPFGKEASDFAKSLLKEGTEVLIEKDISERDKYGRLLAYVYVDGKMLNELLLEEGLARVAYIFPPNTRYVDEFKEIQDKARRDKKGIWSIEDYVHSDGYHTNSAIDK